jgi:parallel beta-helix repeat protein
MKRKRVPAIILTLLLTSMVTLAFNIQPVRATGTVYIRADGSIDPPTAPIQRNGDYYTLTGNITSDGDGITVQKNDVTVDGAGYTVQGTGSGTGIDLTGRSNVTIKNTEIKTFYDGVVLDSSSGNSVSGNNITANNYVGVYLSSSSSNSVSGNNITANDENGVFLSYSSDNNSVSGNNIANNGYGVWLLSSSDNNSVSGNNIANNGDGVWLGYSSDNNSVSGNNITANNGDAVLLYSSSDNNSVSGNNITANNNWGVVLWISSSNNSVVENVFAGCGLSVWDSFGNSVEGNSVNGKPLVYLEDASDRTVGNAGQVILVNCNNIRVENLNLSNTSVGVELWNTTNTKIANNNIANNFYGVYLFDSSGNSIFHNNFANNTVQAYTYGGSANMWDDGYPSGGNHWSDYSGTDHYSGAYQNETGSDGIGDTPYGIDLSNEDHYPLMDQITLLVGDVNKDGYVGIDDLFEIALHFGSEIGQPSYSRPCDINYDGYIGIDDIFTAAQHFGQEG